MSQVPDSETDDDRTLVSDYEKVVKTSSLVTLFGDHAKARILRALLANYPKPLNPSRLVESAGLDSRTSWYNHRDDLLATGLVVEDGNAGNSPLYSLPADDERVEALQILQAVTGEELRKRGR